MAVVAELSIVAVVKVVQCCSIVSGQLVVTAVYRSDNSDSSESKAAMHKSVRIISSDCSEKCESIESRDRSEVLL